MPFETTRSNKIIAPCHTPASLHHNMTHRRLWTMLACLFLLSYVSCAPVPFFGHEKPLTELLPQLALEDIPTYIADDAKISNRTDCIRYGYTIGRPVEPMVHGFWRSEEH